MESKEVFTEGEIRKMMDEYLASDYFIRENVHEIACRIRDEVVRRMHYLSVENILAESVPWSERTFPQSTANSVTVHLMREWWELKASGFEDASEYADVVLLMAHLAFKKGFNLVEAVREKFEINKAREWGEVDAEGVVEHVRDGHPPFEDSEYGAQVGGKHFMKIDSQEERREVHSPPAMPTYRASIKDGMLVFEKMVFRNMSGGEHSWKEIQIGLEDSADYFVCRKLQEMADMGIWLPITVSAHVNVGGKLVPPILNEHWETVVETSKGKLTGRKGKLRSYRKGGKNFVGQPIWDTE